MAESSQLEVWLQGFPREEVEARIQDLRHQLAQAENALALHDSFAGSADSGVASQNGSSGQPANRPEAVRRVLRDGDRPMKSAEIQAAMIEQDWMEDTDEDRKRFYSTLSKMTTRGRVLRLHDRRYVLPK